ncbi:unnamed protein product [Lymnaea stagnalis]|uniref:Uncharacterized protein n=1 Tax=Lymnaea stagnalis TaxID=6523 RepID=A0AAV2H8X5_LYMST
MFYYNSENLRHYMHSDYFHHLTFFLVFCLFNVCKLATSRDGFLRNPMLKGPGRNRSWHRREHDWHSVATSGDLNPPIEYENTYKLKPDGMFVPERVKAIIKTVLQENLHDQIYHKQLMGSRCLVLSDIIKEKVRQLNLARFKIVSVVLLGEKKNQSMMVSSRCLWDSSCDNFATCEYSQGNICAVGMVFAVYQE